jgi:hypothetical protein
MIPGPAAEQLAGPAHHTRAHGDRLPTAAQPVTRPAPMGRRCTGAHADRAVWGHRMAGAASTQTLRQPSAAANEQGPAIRSIDQQTFSPRGRRRCHHTVKPRNSWPTETAQSSRPESGHIMPIHVRHAFRAGRPGLGAHSGGSVRVLRPPDRVALVLSGEPGHAWQGRRLPCVAAAGAPAYGGDREPALCH